MELELKHLAPYLPYGLKFALTMSNDQFTCVGLTVEVDGIMAHHDVGSANVSLFKYYKPILRPISDLEGIPELKSFMMYPNHKNLSVAMFDELLKNHFDVFGLIYAGLAIDINNTKKRPDN